MGVELLINWCQGHWTRCICPGLRGAGCSCVSCTHWFAHSAPECVPVSLQPAVPIRHQPGPPQTPRLPPQVQLWLQLQMPPLRTSPQSLTTQSLESELWAPGLSRWERSPSAAGIGKRGLGHNADKHLTCLVNWMRILHLVSFFFFNPITRKYPEQAVGKPKVLRQNTRNILITGVCRGGWLGHCWVHP